MKKCIRALCGILIMVLLSGSMISVSAEGGMSVYDSYNYSAEDKKEISAAPSYLPVKTIFSKDLGLSEFNDISDLFIDELNNQIYIVDSGNNHIIKAKTDFTQISIISGAVLSNGNIEKFTSPQGIFVDKEQNIYVADTGNKRVMKLDKDGNYLYSFEKPDSPQFEQNIEYKPTKVAVASTGDISIVCEGIYEGIVTIDQTGAFQGYSGMNLVEPSLWDIFWRSISTRAQRKAMKSFYPVTFLNLDINSDNFVYATSQADSNNGNSNAVQRLNPGGNDTLQNSTNYDIIGDLGNIYDGRAVGNSVFCDICCLDNGIYACVDRVRSKVFIYNSDGILLFVFGNSGSQDGCVDMPVAIDNLGYSLYVADSVKKGIVVFEPTEYSKCIYDGLNNYRIGEYDKANLNFNLALRYDSNSEISYLIIGKTFFRSGEYKKAMECFKLASNRNYYSKALKNYRQQVLEENFIVLFILILLIIVFFCIRGFIKNKKKTNSKVEKNTKLSRFNKSLDFSVFCAFHPFKGFYEMKYEKEGTVSASFVLVVLYSVTSMLSVTLKGYVFQSTTETVNIFWEMLKVLLPFILFAVANWCITTLMEGEGNMRDIAMSTAYALTPAIFGNVILTVISNILTNEEAGIYYAVSAIVLVWTIALLLIGNMQIHNFSMSRTVGATVITVLTMAIIVFLIFLIVNLGVEVVAFVSEIIEELIY